MGVWYNNGKNRLLDHLDTLITDISLHTATPSTAGSNEVTGGTYARLALALDPAAAGEKDIDGAVIFDVPAGVTVSHVGFWDGSTFLGYDDLPASQPFGADGTLTVDTLTFSL